MDIEILKTLIENYLATLVTKYKYETYGTAKRHAEEELKEFLKFVEEQTGLKILRDSDRGIIEFIGKESS